MNNSGANISLSIPENKRLAEYEAEIEEITALSDLIHQQIYDHNAANLAALCVLSSVLQQRAYELSHAYQSSLKLNGGVIVISFNYGTI